MATVIVRYCDQHMAAGEELPAEAWSLTVTPPGERVTAFDVDLCPQCAQGLVDLIEHFEDIARKGSAPAASRSAGSRSASRTQGDTDTEIECPICHKVSANRAALGAHARRAHKRSLSEILGENLRYQCLRCDEPAPKFGSPVGFSAHRRQVHGIPAGTPYLEGEDLRTPTPSPKASKSTKKSKTKAEDETLM